MPTTQPDNLEPLLNAQQEHLSLLFSDSESIDAKTLGIAGANIAFLIFIGQIQLDAANWLIIVLVGLYLLSIVFNALAIRPRRYIGPGVNIDASPEFLNMDKGTLILQLLGNTQKAIKQNDSLNKVRWNHCLRSFALTAIATALLFGILGL